MKYTEFLYFIGPLGFNFVTCCQTEWVVYHQQCFLPR